MSTLKPTYTSLKFRPKIHYTTVRAVSVKSKAKLGFSLISEASGELLKLQKNSRTKRQINRPGKAGVHENNHRIKGRVQLALYFPSLPKPYLGILCLFLSFSLGFSPRSDALFIVEIKERGSEGRSEEAEGDKRMRGISTSIQIYILCYRIFESICHIAFGNFEFFLDNFIDDSFQMRRLN